MHNENHEAFPTLSYEHKAKANKKLFEILRRLRESHGDDKNTTQTEEPTHFEDPVSEAYFDQTNNAPLWNPEQKQKVRDLLLQEAQKHAPNGLPLLDDNQVSRIFDQFNTFLDGEFPSIKAPQQMASEILISDNAEQTARAIKDAITSINQRVNELEDGSGKFIDTIQRTIEEGDPTIHPVALPPSRFIDTNFAVEKKGEQLFLVPYFTVGRRGLPTSDSPEMQRHKMQIISKYIFNYIETEFPEKEAQAA